MGYDEAATKGTLAGAAMTRRLLSERKFQADQRASGGQRRFSSGAPIQAAWLVCTLLSDLRKKSRAGEDSADVDLQA